MKFRKTAALTAAALVLGLVVGNVATGVAAPAADAGTTNTVQGVGLRIGAAVRDAGGRLADVVADLTGLSTDEVVAQRADGKSFEQIAESEGVETSAVIAETLKVREQVLDAKVADGTATQEQADAAIERMKARLTDRVASTDASCDGAGAGSGGGGMRRGAADGTGAGGGGKGGRGMGGNGGVCTEAPVVAQ
jgi:hypothetical protein